MLPPEAARSSRANEAFTSSQLAPRIRGPPSGSSPTQVVLVVVDGRRSGYSVGMTNFELAQTLVGSGRSRRRASTAAARPRSRPRRHASQPPVRSTERPVSTSLQLMYYGAFAPAVLRDLAERGRGGRDPAPAHLQARAAVERDRDPDARWVVASPRRPKPPGTYPVAFPPAPLDPLAPPAEPAAPAEGKWRLGGRRDRRPGLEGGAEVLGQQHPRLRRISRALVLRKGGKQSIAAGVSLTRPARVLATVETAAGVRIAPIAVRDAPRAGCASTGRERSSARSSTAGSTGSASGRGTSSARSGSTKPFHVIRRRR